MNSQDQINTIFRSTRTIYVTIFLALALFATPITLPSIELQPLSDTRSDALFVQIVNAATDGASMSGYADTGEAADAGVFEGIIRTVLGFIGNLLITITSAMMWFFGMLFEGAIQFLIVDMVEMSPMVTIEAVWTVIRDICNLAFIFGFLYLGFQMIFDPHSAEAKRTLSHIVIGALLINFSLFFVKVIIDIGNFIAVTIYNTGTAGIQGASIPAAITQVLGVAGLWGAGTDPNAFQSMTGWGMVGYYFMAAIFLSVCAFVFASAAIMLVTRFVTLILILMASPILFAGTVFPQTEHFVSDLWKKLITSSIFPAVFLFMMYVALKTLDFLRTHIDGANVNMADALHGSVGFMPVVIFFCVAIFFLLQALSVSRSLAEGGHGILANATKSANKYIGRAVGATTAGLAARGMRRTIGRAAYNVAESDKWKDRAGGKGVAAWASRQVRGVAKAGASATFDVRNAVKDSTFGGGIESGFKEYKEETIQKRLAEAQELGVVKDTDVKVKARKVEMEEAQRKTQGAQKTLTELEKEQSKRETKVKQLQQELSAASTLDEKVRISTDIDKIKEEIEQNKGAVTSQRNVVERLEHVEHEAKEAYEQERHRRQIGSTFVEHSPEIEKEIETFKHDIHELTEKISEEWGEYAKIPANDKAAQKKAREKIEGLDKQLKNKKKEQHAYMVQLPERGIAAIYENAKWYDKAFNLARGRDIGIEQEAAKKLWESAQHGSVVGNVKKKDKAQKGHGGGHDDHAPKAGGHDGGHAPAGGGGHH